jgi:hypothetical protein
MPRVESTFHRGQRPDFVELHLVRVLSFISSEARRQVFGTEVNPSKPNADSVTGSNHRRGKPGEQLIADGDEGLPSVNRGTFEHDGPG